MSYQYRGDMRPYEHQLATIKFMLANKRGYVFNDMGTGKTPSTLWFFDMLRSANHVKTMLVIAPLSTLQAVWGNEIEKMVPHLSYAICHGNRASRIESFQSKCDIYITNTDAVRTYEKEIVELNPDVIAIDEVTAFANHGSKRSKAMQRISTRCKSIFGLSGNPVAGGLINSYGIAKVINPKQLPTRYYTQYRNMILNQVTMYEYVEKPGALDIVNSVLQPAISYRLEECVDIPPIVFETRKVKLPKPTMDLFKEMVDHQIAEYKEGIITAATAGVKAIRLGQILTGCTKTEEGELIKTDVGPMHLELVDIYHESGNKLVVFTQSVAAVVQINEFFKKKKIKCNMIYGKVPQGKRDRIITDFQDSDEGVLVAQVRTMSHGITLTKSHVIAFFGVVAGNETYRQAIRRIRRIGQTHRQTIIKLISTKFEEKSFQKLDSAEFTSDAMLEMYKKGMSEFI